LENALTFYKLASSKNGVTAQKILNMCEMGFSRGSKNNYWYGIFMAKGARENIKMKSTESNECYWTTKNKRNVTERIELKKYDKSLRRHAVFKEAK
jgi:large subunit ribosomal protein L33